MPGAGGQLKKLYQQLIGGVAPTDASSSTGSVAAMVKYLIANPPSAIQNRMWLPGRFTTPVDVTIAGSVALTEQINYFKNLTINAGVVLTGVAGGTIIVVEETLTLVDAASRLTVTGLGAKPSSLTRAPGYGGGCWAPNGAGGSGLIATQGFLSLSTISASNPYLRQPLQSRMPFGGAGATGGGAAATAGGAWPNTTGSLFYNSVAATAIDNDWQLFLWLLDFIKERNTEDATYGAIGGGCGGTGSRATGVGAGGATGTALGGIGLVGVAAGGGGSGGSGFGGGGGGGGNNSGTAGTGMEGGRGSGVLLVLCKTLNNSGIIDADGAAGGAAVTHGQGGGGGGGGAVLVGYENLTNLGTVRANGGAAGTGIDSGGAAAAGGAGLSGSFKIRSGV